METKIKYIVADASEKGDETAFLIARVEVSGEIEVFDRLLTLTVRHDSELVVEDYDGDIDWWGEDEYESFEVAYIVARARLELPFGWVTGEGKDSNIARQLVQKPDEPRRVSLNAMKQGRHRGGGTSCCRLAVAL